MAKLDDSAREYFRQQGAKGAKKRWKSKTAEEKSAIASNASHAYWDSMSPEERSAEMKRRAAKRKKRPK
jgi:hypothetical protein